MNSETVATIHKLSGALRQLAQCFDDLCPSITQPLAGVDVRTSTAPPAKEKFDRNRDTAPDCPECEAPMKKRTSARGPFWGCSNYPRCQAIRKIGGEGRDWRAQNRDRSIERGSDD
jgi:topoisomerase-like DNA binding C4 zinc finger protein